MNSVFWEILKEVHLTANLLSSGKLSQEQTDELNIKLNKEFSKKELKELNETLFKFNEKLKDETDTIL